jgi:hypothetical protein
MLVEDDRCSIPENSPPPCHFTTQEEEIFEISAVSLERLMSLLRQGVEGRFEDAVIVEVGFVGAGVSSLHT